jgi:zinc-binding alcohol dehydrogenase family protein
MTIPAQGHSVPGAGFNANAIHHSNEINMKAIGYSQTGPADVLFDVEIAKPIPGPRDLLVAIKAVSVNPVDSIVRRNVAPSSDQPKILGYDAAGVVEAVGSEVTLFKVGDEVYYGGAIDRPGTNSEFHVVDERIVGRKPSTLSFEDAAALPLTALTAWELLFDRLGVARTAKQGGETLLIINGAGGVGSILVQLARRLTSLTVVATASRPETTAWVQKMGAHFVVSHRQPLDVALHSIGLEQVKYVAGLTGTAKQMPVIASLIAPQGRLAVIDDGALDIEPLKAKSVTVSWEMVFTRSLFKTDDMQEQHRVLNEVSALVDAGLIVTTATKCFGTINRKNLIKAHHAIESGATVGKVVLAGFGNG